MLEMMLDVILEVKLGMMLKAILKQWRKCNDRTTRLRDR
ncbi:hypothetical protein C8J27_103192 [Rhodobacter aestuarii]|uniref:Uncharacterized protein n=1 Tax=Rhodobacter aestuarii TaxID=453582 RepID=A0A1N7K4F1_9RHOB|nr:hypothetical protein C8J27_103192 [Rhodobacter aestuarii]SIS56426.1 hypothetical protein SAMN05421580_102242 [Rhodobacter aestuarii]